ncbi:hypothetical protein GCM10020370_17000 [Paenibacillus hodogayensis]
MVKQNDDKPAIADNQLWRCCQQFSGEYDESSSRYGDNVEYIRSKYPTENVKTCKTFYGLPE